MYTKEEMRELVTLLNEAARAYYELDAPIMQDSEYDALYGRLCLMEEELRERLDDSPTRRIGGRPLASFPPHKHAYKLWSMDKCQNAGELRAWLTRIEKLLGRTPSFFVEHKLDGLTINLTYHDGRLIQAATRGDGETGEGVLPQTMTIGSVPLTIPYRGFIEVQGECFMKLSILRRYNESAAEPLKNARNAAAGALRNLDAAVTASRRLSAFFYHVGTPVAPPLMRRDQMNAFLISNGFPVCPFLKEADAANPEESILRIVDTIESDRSSLDYLIDGAVISVGEAEARETLGYTDKFPRWSIAYKFKAEEAITTLKAVTWEVGRTGKLTPLAHLHETDFTGVTVRHATLNNFQDITRKQLNIGCMVRLRRANDVIPEIIGRTDETQPGEIPIDKPMGCPACGTPISERGANLYCDNKLACKPQAVMRLTHYASRDAMDIDNLSEKTCSQLFDALGVRDPSGLYTLTMESLTALEGFGEKRAGNLLAAIKRTRNIALDAFLFALGIPLVGRKTARDLAGYFVTLEAVINAREENLLALEEVGPVMAACITAYFADDCNRILIRKLLECGVQPQARVHSGNGMPLTGKTVVITGTLPHYKRSDMAALIIGLGGSVSETVGKKTDYVVAGENAGSKLTKAHTLRIPVFSEEAFLEKMKYQSNSESL